MNRTVVEIQNLTDKDFEFMYGGIQYKVLANERLDVLEDVAFHARKKSIMSYSLETGRAIYQVGIVGVHDLTPLGAGKKPDEELIDRDSDPDGDKAAVINVRGGKIVEETDSLA